MSNKLYFESLDHPVSHPVRPSHINCDEHFWNAFDNDETEISARWIVRYCQTKGCNLWVRFTKEQINQFVNERGHRSSFCFNKLLPEGYVVLENDLYCLTHEFICRCFMSSPVAEEIVIYPDLIPVGQPS